MSVSKCPPPPGSGLGLGWGGSNRKHAHTMPGGFWFGYSNAVSHVMMSFDQSGFDQATSVYPGDESERDPYFACVSDNIAQDVLIGMATSVAVATATACVSASLATAGGGCLPAAGAAAPSAALNGAVAGAAATFLSGAVFPEGSR